MNFLEEDCWRIYYFNLYPRSAHSIISGEFDPELLNDLSANSRTVFFLLVKETWFWFGRNLWDWTQEASRFSLDNPEKILLKISYLYLNDFGGVINHIKHLCQHFQSGARPVIGLRIRHTKHRRIERVFQHSIMLFFKKEWKNQFE